VTRLAYLLADLPVDLLGRMRANRALQLPAPARAPGTRGRTHRRGGEFRSADPATWPTPQLTTATRNDPLRNGEGHHLGPAAADPPGRLGRP
jgi:hypothetical protein